MYSLCGENIKKDKKGIKGTENQDHQKHTSTDRPLYEIPYNKQTFRNIV